MVAQRQTSTLGTHGVEYFTSPVHCPSQADCWGLLNYYGYLSASCVTGGSPSIRGANAAAPGAHVSRPAWNTCLTSGPFVRNTKHTEYSVLPVSGTHGACPMKARQFPQPHAANQFPRSPVLSRPSRESQSGIVLSRARPPTRRTSPGPDPKGHTPTSLGDVGARTLSRAPARSLLNHTRP